MLFERDSGNYLIEDDVVRRMLADPASPISLICDAIPEGASVLDVGAGNGVLGRALSLSGKRVYIDGIEPSDYAADLAMPYYRTVYNGFLEEFISEVSGKKYDFLVLADVIEHIANPQAFMKMVCSLLSDDMRLFVSVPNVAFGAVRLSLMKGKFNYTQSGILEATHLRFFTLATAERLFDSLGVQVASVNFMCRSLFRSEIPRSDMSLSPFSVIPLVFNTSSLSYQYVFEIRRRGKESIIYNKFGISPIAALLDYAFGWLYEEIKGFSLVRKMAEKLRKLLSGKR